MPAATSHQLTGTYVLDPTSIRVRFAARHSFGPAVHGRFQHAEGVGHLDADDPSHSRVDLTIDAGGIDTGSRRRDDQLRSRFLDSQRHPRLVFASTGIEPAPGWGYRVTGDLMVRGVTSEVTLTFEPTRQLGPDVRFTSTVVVSRHGLGVVRGSVWDRMVADEVTVMLDVALTRRRPRERPRIIWSGSSLAPVDGSPHTYIDGGRKA